MLALGLAGRATAAAGRLLLLGAGGRGLATCRPALAAERVAHGFSSPGNSGTSEEMKEVGRPDVVRENEEAVQMHHFSEKMRFDKASFKNAEKARGHAADPGDTGSDRAVSEASSQTAQGQTHGVMHQSPETLPYAREAVGEKREHEALQHMGDMPVEEAAAKGYTVLPGSKNAMAPSQPEGRRSFRTAAWAGQRGAEGRGAERGIDPGVGYSPPAPQEDFDPARTPKPDTPDEEAPAIERAAWEEAGGEAHLRSGVAGTALEWEGIAPDKAPKQKGDLHTWAAPRSTTAGRGLRTTVAHAYAKGSEGREQEGFASSPAEQREELAGLKAAGGGSPAETTAGQPTGASRPVSPGPQLAEEQDVPAGTDPEEVMEERIKHPEIGGYAS